MNDESVTCGECGATVWPREPFCPRCGARLLPGGAKPKVVALLLGLVAMVLALFGVCGLPGRDGAMNGWGLALLIAAWCLAWLAVVVLRRRPKGG